MIEDYREQWNKKVTYHYKNTTYPSYSVYLLNYSKETVRKMQSINKARI